MRQPFVRKLGLLAVFFCLLAPQAGRCDYLVAEGEYRIAVRVTPRLGAFDADLFKEARNEGCAPAGASGGKMGWEDYRQLLDKQTPPLDYQLPDAGLSAGAAALFRIPGWDILTTKLPGKAADCNYGARRVLITVLAPGGATPQSCEFSLPDQIGNTRPQRGAGFCAVQATLASNAETPVRIKIKMPGSDAVQLNSKVPEDVLIVSLGDSFASGEGNPDAPKRYEQVQDTSEVGMPPKSVFVPAVWMDPWCHRSAYAGPLRAGLKLLRQPDSVANARYRQALAAGALTVVSFACSGGKLSDSLLGSYAGVRLRKDVMKERSVKEYTGKDAVLDTDVTMQPQIEQLHTFLGTQRTARERRKTSIDLLLLSGGGNDVLFGPMMVGLMLKNLASEEKKQKLAVALEHRFDALRKDYHRFADTFRNNVFRMNNDEYAVRSIVSVPYPDFASQSDSASCTRSDMGDVQDLQAEDIGLATGVSQLLFSRKELEFVRTAVLKRLNGMIVETAGTYGWRTLNVSRYGADVVNRHGWCRPGGKPFYAGQQRWFRAPQDSAALQANLNGSYHPSWEYNEKIVGSQAAAEFAAAVDAEPDGRSIVLEPASRAGAVLLTSARPVLRYAGTFADGVCQKIYIDGQTVPLAELGGSGCMRQPAAPLGGHGASFELVRDARNVNYQRQYARAALGTIRVDALPPVLECRSGAGAWSACGSFAGWTRERQLRVRAVDADAGVESLVLGVTGPATQRWEVPVSRSADGALEGMIDFPEDGVYTVAACAVDRVKNQTGAGGACEVRFGYGLDTKPLSPLSLTAYDVDWLDNAAPAASVPVIPVFVAVGRGAMVRVQFEGDLSGAAAAPDCPLIAEGACLHALDAPAAYWQKKVISKSYADGAGNTSTFSYAMVRIPRYQAGKQPRSADDWQADAAADELVQGLRTALWIEPGLARLVAAQAGGSGEVDAVLSDASTQAARKSAASAILAMPGQRALLTQWLNIVHGYQYAEAEVAPGAAELCAANAGTAPERVYAYRALQMQTRCALTSLAAVPPPEQASGAGGQGGAR